MSIITIRRTDTGFEIASDSIGVWGNTQVKDAEKLWQISGDLILGSVGQSSFGNFDEVLSFQIGKSVPKIRKKDGWNLPTIPSICPEIRSEIRRQQFHYRLQIRSLDA